ncbi:MAG: hypothetical protein WEB07_02165 [Natronospirillum sp.]
MNWSLDTQLKVMLVLFFFGVFTLVLWIPAGLWALCLSWTTQHPVARGGVKLFWHSWVFWIATFLILPFSLTQLAIVIPAGIIMAWGAYLLYRCVQLWGDLYMTPMN